MLKLPEGVTAVIRHRPSAKAAIVKNGKILIIQEELKNHDGSTQILYDLPGGGIDLGEGLIEGLIREVHEEVGLSIQAERVIGAWDYVVRERGDIQKGLQAICIGYQCSLVGSEEIDTEHNPAADENIFAATWMTKQEILALNASMVTNPGFRQAIEAVVV